jgi:phosphoesterase RecJ-like protein
LPHIDKISLPKDIEAETGILLDTNSWDRLGKKTRKIVELCLRRLNIDHHLGEGIGDHNWIAPNVSSCSEMVYYLSEELKVEIDRDIAQLLYVGIATDTGFFSFANTTPESLSVSAELLRYGIRPDEVKEAIYNIKSYQEIRFLGEALYRLNQTEGVVWTKITREMVDRVEGEPDFDNVLDEMRRIKDAKIVLLLRELDSKKTKVSLRSKEQIDVASIAERFGGGGHRQAAGCVLNIPIAEAEIELLSALSMLQEPSDQKSEKSCQDTIVDPLKDVI